MKNTRGKLSHCVVVFIAGKESALVFLDHLMDYKKMTVLNGTGHLGTVLRVICTH